MDWDEAMEIAREDLGYYKDEYLEGHQWEEVVEEAKSILEEEREENRELAREEYREYLCSDAWKNKRQIVLKRDNFLCRDCGALAQDVHHLNYEYLHTDKETAFCVALCRICHKKRHAHQ